MEDREKPLAGGTRTKGVVRVGDTVRRPVGEHSDFVVALLNELERSGFDGAPRYLGRDERGRDILSYIEGEAAAIVGAPLSEATLLSAAELVRRFHDATAALALRGDEEVVCHTDLGPHNMVFRDEEAVALIDWEGAEPGSRLRDVAHAAWCCVPIEEGGPELSEQARRLKLFCDRYGELDPLAVLDEIERYHERAVVSSQELGLEPAVLVHGRLLRWHQRFAPAIKQELLQ